MRIMVSAGSRPSSRESVDALREAVRLREWLARTQPAELQHRTLLAATLNWLAKAYVQLKDFDAAYNCLHRRLDLQEQLNLDSHLADQKPAISQSHILLGELAEVRGDRTGAMRWYARASLEKDGQAVRKIATLLQLAPELAPLLPADVRAVYLRMTKAGTSIAAPKFVADFCTEFENSQKEAIRKQESRQMAELQETIDVYQDLAEVYAGKGRREDYIKILSKEFDARGQQVAMSPSNRILKDFQANTAAKLAQSFMDQKQMESAVEWAQTAARLGHAESLFQLADCYENGTNGPAEPKKAQHYRYLGHYTRGKRSFREHNYQLALPDLKKVCESAEADADDHDTLAMCYGKLDRWDDAIKSYTRSIELDMQSERGTGVVLNLLEALTCADRPEQLLQFVPSIEKKGWKLPKEGSEADKYAALFHGFQAIALVVSGKDASQAEQAMRRITGKPNFKITDWTWDELNTWFKKAKLAPTAGRPSIKSSPSSRFGKRHERFLMGHFTNHRWLATSPGCADTPCHRALIEPGTVTPVAPAESQRPATKLWPVPVTAVTPAGS